MGAGPGPATLRVGGWLFRNRGWLPVPLLALGLVLGPRHWGAGLGILGAGEALRLWAVGHIGLPSRTRGADGGPLVAEGPYAYVRNPLYLGNLLLFAGYGVLCWPAALVLVPAMALHYHFIVAWEEQVLEDRLGAAYAAYRAAVPRWWPGRRPAPGGGAAWDARRALRSERSTLLAILILLSAVFLRSWTL